MATYNYRCTQCNKKFSISIPVACKPADRDLFCPVCHIAGTSKRIWDKFSFILKSKGFYKTDQSSANE